MNKNPDASAASAGSSAGPRIVYVVTSSPSVGFLRGQLAYLRALGFDVTVICSPGEALSSIADSDGVQIVALAIAREISPIRDLISLSQLARRLKRLRPAITNVSTPKAGLLGGLAAVWARVPCRVYTLRGLRLETATGVQRHILWLAERVACLCADRVVCVSDDLRRKAVALGLVAMKKTAVLGAGSSRGVDGKRFYPVEAGDPRVSELREKLRIAQNAPVVGFVGRLTRDKGIAGLLAAFSGLRLRFPELRLLLVGEVEAHDLLPLSVRQNIGNDPHIICTGPVSDTALYYHAMDVVVLPTYREGFPNVVLEASASAKPVVVTRATGAVDSVKDGVTGLLIPVGDTRALTEAIARLLSEPALRARMGRAGREWMEQEFRPEEIWKAQAKLYREMIDEGSWPPCSRLGRLAKRTFDVLAATTALLAAAPLLLLVAILIRSVQGRPVLFRQLRPGRHGHPFSCLKFRTMTDNRGADGQLLPDEDRLTALGRFLRSTSLDELPELINVIRGEMSLVGPRPLLMSYLDRYTPEQSRRHEVRPGITGWAQINGRNAASWEQKLAYDVWYVDHRTFWLDLKILLLTFWKTLTREGISQPGHATAEEFMGRK
jgi:lipopolysaccharide/colanic/teichoic acid biosynthesis glycosyltransferase